MTVFVKYKEISVKKFTFFSPNDSYYSLKLQKNLLQNMKSFK